MVELRPYQIETINKLRKSTIKSKKILTVLPTGAGKTIIFGQIVHNALEKGKIHNILILAHRRNLIYQTQNVFKEKFGIDAGIIMAGESHSFGKQVYIASKDTLVRRLDDDDPTRSIQHVPADLIIIDEAHLSATKTYQKILSHYPKSLLLGFTATPCRSDGKGLGCVFDTMIETATTGELIKSKYLCDVRYFVPSRPDLKKLKTAGDDYIADKNMEKAMDKPKIIGNIVEHWLKYGEDQKTLIFAVNIRHSMHICEAFEKAGIKTWHLDGSSSDDERDNAFTAMENGNIKIICNVGLYREGLDVPNIGCIIMARPTKSIGLYRQCVGRGLRKSPGKPYLIFFDFAGIVDELGTLDLPIIWTLKDDKKAEIKEKVRKQKEKRLFECKVCGELFDGINICPTCGTELKKYAKDIASINGKLEEIEFGKKLNRKEGWGVKVQAIEYLRYLQRKKGYQDGWVAHKYKEIFGRWPNHPNVKYTSPVRHTEGQGYNYVKYILIKNHYDYHKGATK